MADSFETVAKRTEEAARSGVTDKHAQLRSMTAMQRKCLELFERSETIASRDIQEFFNYKPRSATAILSRWVNEGFLVVHDPGLRTRSYALAEHYRKLLD